jgi:translation initiation factor 2B subunit (eIF-2B alpha/beta/delta family)
MKQKDKKILCSLIRDHEDTVGSSRVTMMALEAFVASIRRVRCGMDEARALYIELSEALKNTEPKVIPLIHLIEEFEEEVRKAGGTTIEAVKERAIAILQVKHAKIAAKVDQAIEHGLACIDDGDTIIVHTLGHDVTNMLKRAREELQKNFKVIVLKQDLAKTRRLIKSLSTAGIDMEIVPEYGLIHYIEQSNKVFMEALSITEDMKVVCAVGSANILSLCHLNRLPIYLFANTLKFSHRPSSHQQIHRKVEAHTHDDVCYDLVTHSHDTVDLRLIDFFVSENGIMDKAAIARDLLKSGDAGPEGA